MSLLSTLATDLGVSVQLSTAFTPALALVGPSNGMPAEDTGGFSLLAVLQPQVQVVDSGGGVLASVAPFGVPSSPEGWGLAALLGIGLAAGLIGVGYWLGRP